jgi:H+/Cl- antiporter ClcA
LSHKAHLLRPKIFHIPETVLVILSRCQTRTKHRHSPGRWALSSCGALAILVGVVAGLGAVVFRILIAFLHNLLLLGRVSAAYDANRHTPASPWGPFVVLVPVVGALGVAFLVKNFAPEAKGHGVPEVMDAVYHRQGVIRPVVAVVKALASALSIGSGGSVGREGPIIQIGSAFGSTMGQVLRLPVWQVMTLIAGGAGGGIAATFNTPVGGVIFAVEIVMNELSARTLAPVLTATATATYVGQLFLGPQPSFLVPAFETTHFDLANPLLLLAYMLLGVITGLVSALFIHSIYGFERFFERHVKGGYYVQHPAGMLRTTPPSPAGFCDCPGSERALAPACVPTSWFVARRRNVRINGRWTYLYRAVDSAGDTIDFLWSPKASAKIKLVAKFALAIL